MHTMLLIAALQAAQVGPARVPPTDECRSDPTFVEYRAQLTGIVARKDAAALQALVATDVLVDLGGGVGWADFVKEWALDRPLESELWSELATVLELGCEELDGQRLMPGNFSRLSEFDDPLPPYFAVEKDAVLRSRPDDSSPVVTTLDHHLLFANGEADTEGWLHARLTDGRSGYVRLSSVRSAIDYRAGFEKRDGQWLMTSFVAGD